MEPYKILCVPRRPGATLWVLALVGFVTSPVHGAEESPVVILVTLCTNGIPPCPTQSGCKIITMSCTPGSGAGLDAVHDATICLGGVAPVVQVLGAPTPGKKTIYCDGAILSGPTPAPYLVSNPRFVPPLNPNLPGTQNAQILVDLISPDGCPDILGWYLGTFILKVVELTASPTSSPGSPIKGCLNSEREITVTVNPPEEIAGVTVTPDGVAVVSDTPGVAGSRVIKVKLNKDSETVDDLKIVTFKYAGCEVKSYFRVYSIDLEAQGFLEVPPNNLMPCLKNDELEPGVIIALNNDDDDNLPPPPPGNGISDSNDLGPYNEPDLVPIKVTFKPNPPDASSPPKITYPQGTLKLWKNNDKTMLFPSGTTLQAPISLYMECIAQSAPIDVLGTYHCDDLVKVTVANPTLTMQGLPEELPVTNPVTPNEEAPGAYISVNRDNDEGNADCEYDMDELPAKLPIGYNDDELIQVKVATWDKPFKGKVTLQIPPGTKAWRDNHKAKQITIFSWDLTKCPDERTSATGWPIPQELYLEGMAVGAGDMILAYNGPASKQDKIRVNIIEADLDVDSNNDGVIGDGVEEDKCEDAAANINLQRVGKILCVNNGDRDGDKIPDYADGYNSPGGGNNAGAGASAKFTPMILALKGNILPSATVTFSYQGSDPLQVGSQQQGYSTPPGFLRIWTKDGNQARNGFPISANGPGNFVKPDEAYTLQDLGDQNPVAGPRTFSLFIEGISASQQTADMRIEVWVDPDGPAPGGVISDLCKDAVRCTIIDPQITADYDRDRTIGDADRKLARAYPTFRFWINDDNDSGDESGNDIPGTQVENSANQFVNGIRDLVDFFPVFCDLKSTLNLLGTTTLKYELRTRGAWNTLLTDLVPESSGDYLINADAANALAHQKLATQAELEADTYDLSPDFLGKIKNEGRGIILFEGRFATTHPITLRILDSQGQEICQRRILVRSSGVEAMFRHLNLTSAANGEQGTIGPADRLGDPANYPDSATDGKNFVFLHGYNVNPEGARGWHAEMFKRLYWSGLKSKFHGVTWKGAQTKFGSVTRNYHANVANAFLTAPLLKVYLDSLGTHLTVAAHSLGNMVVSSALHDHSAAIPNYIMIDAAVAMEAYQSGGNSLDMVPLDWDPYLQQGQERLLCSEWHKLFTAGDHRSELTWRNRLANLRGASVYNFYSPGEEVLATHPHNEVPAILDTGLGFLAPAGL